MAASVVGLPAGSNYVVGQQPGTKKKIRWKSSEKAPSPSQVDGKFLPKGIGYQGEQG
jgi:hypothetical protein